MNIALMTATMMNFQRALSDKKEEHKKNTKESNIKGLKLDKIYFEELLEDENIDNHIPRID